MRDAIRLKHYFVRTEQAYVSWVNRYTLVHDRPRGDALGDHSSVARAVLRRYH